MMRTITHTYQIQEVSDEEAEILMKEFIEERKKKGIREISELDFYVYLHLPIEQANRIMPRLAKKGIVKESA